MNKLLWRWWNEILDKDVFLDRLTKVVILIWIAAGLAGMFATYRFGEYVQTKRFVAENWHPVIIESPQTN